MEVIRGRESDYHQEIRGEAERGGARAACMSNAIESGLTCP